MHNPSATLLIIDDDDVVRASLAAYLDDSGFKVLQAPNGPRGMELFDAEHPDLVICDLRMPQMDGLELIRLISERQVEGGLRLSARAIQSVQKCSVASSACAGSSARGGGSHEGA